MGVEMPDGETVFFYDCPRNCIPVKLQKYLHMFSDYREGRLWYPGSIGQQPARYYNAMRIISHEVSLIEQEEADRRSKIRNTAAGKNFNGSLPRKSLSGALNKRKRN